MTIIKIVNISKTVNIHKKNVCFEGKIKIVILKN